MLLTSLLISALEDSESVNREVDLTMYSFLIVLRVLLVIVALGVSLSQYTNTKYRVWWVLVALLLPEPYLLAIVTTLVWQKVQNRDRKDAV
jgi:hypothetical protein